MVPIVRYAGFCSAAVHTCRFAYVGSAAKLTVFFAHWAWKVSTISSVML